MKIANLNFQHHKQGPYFFRDLSFELEEGQIHALHGKNGVGKSVLLHLLSQQCGEITLLTQQFDQTLVGQFSFLENLQFATLKRFPSPFARLKSYLQMPQLLEKFHIDINLPVYKLSGGQRQILALLMKLQKDTKVLLLDEPTGALDEQNAIMVFEFLQNLKGVTMLIVCHDQELIKRYTTGRHLHLEIDANGQRRLK